MNKKLIVLPIIAMAFGALVACGPTQKTGGVVKDKWGYEVDTSKFEEELTILGGCEEPYLEAISDAFGKKYGVKVNYTRISSGEIETKIKEENGNPSADVLFGGTTDPYNALKAAGLLEAYKAQRASHIKESYFKDADNTWFGIYKGILGLMYNKNRIKELNLPAPTGWDDLIKSQYKGYITSSNPSTAGTAKLVINTNIQRLAGGKKVDGHYDTTKGMEYLVNLDKNVIEYTKSGSGASKQVGKGECVIGIGFLHDVITQIVDNQYDNIGMVAPKEGTAFEVGATAMLKGAKHPYLAKAFIEFALSPECVELGAQNGSYQFLVLDDAKQPQAAIDAGLSEVKVIDYDFDDAKANTSYYVTEFLKQANADSRFKTA